MTEREQAQLEQLRGMGYTVDYPREQLNRTCVVATMQVGGTDIRLCAPDLETLVPVAIMVHTGVTE